MNALFLKYQQAYNNETGKNIIFGGKLKCEKCDDGYLLHIYFIGKINNNVEYLKTKNFFVTGKETIKTLYMDGIYFKNIIDDIDEIINNSEN